MNRYYIKTFITIVLCGFCISVMAETRFIVKYKLTESQKAFLWDHRSLDEKENQALIRRVLMQKLSKEQLDVILKTANEILSKEQPDVLLKATNEMNIFSTIAEIQIIHSHSLSNGAHVIILSEDLDQIQIERFINNVEQNETIEYIEEDKMMHHC